MPESKTMTAASRAAMYGPDGNVYQVDNANLREAVSNGGEMAVPMVSPKGDKVWVRASQVSQAQKQGGKVDWSTVPQEHHEGFWSALGSDLWGMAKGIPSMALDAGKVLSGDPEPFVQQAQMQMRTQQARKDEGRSAAYQTVAPLAPLAGVNAEAMENAAREGDTAGVAGHAAAPVVGMAATAGVAKATPKIVKAAGRAALFGKTPEGAYESALKPSTTIPEAKRAAIVQTALKEGIPVSEGGLQKLQTLIDDVNQKIKATIDADPNRPINKFAVAKRLGDTAKQFENQVNPKADLQAISDAGNEFLESQPGAIAASDAQALKTGTYRQLKSKAYGELKGASIEAQKALARGLKEELASAFPELKELNARDSQLLQLEPVLEKAVNRIGNHQVAGIGTPVAAAGAKAVTGSNAVAGTAAFIKAVVDNPYVKSRLAIAMSRKGVPISAANARIAAYSAALGRGVASSDENQGDQSTQSQQ